jgi:hypothetical protein
MDNYSLETIQYIVQNQTEIIDQCHSIKKISIEDLTKTYYKYNLFSLTSGSIHFYEIYKYLRNYIIHKLPNEKLWFQSWLNYHKEDEVLDWHTHAWDYHGYISIDPKDTTTEFDGYQIKNKTGQIYFGPGFRNHRVKVDNSYSDYRITIGFDITSVPIMHTGCFGLFPLI